MTHPSHKPNPFQRLLTVASDHATTLGLTVLAMGGLGVAASAGSLPEAVIAILSGLGWAAFSELLGKAADDDLSNEALLEAIREELSAQDWLTEPDLSAALQTFFQQNQDFLAGALAGLPEAVALQLADALEAQNLLTRQGVTLILTTLREKYGELREGQKELDQRVRAGVIYLRKELDRLKEMVHEEGEATRETVQSDGAKTREAVEDLGAQIQQGFARLAPQPGLGKLSLPGRPTHFIGREDLLAQVTPLLHPGHVLTLWGPGGMGKTTLAAQALWEMHDAGDLLRRFPDGVLNYDFYGEPSPTGVYERIIYHFAAPPPGAKIEATREAARAALAGKHALLVLDGAENTPHLRDVLDARGACGVLITSRNPADVLDTGLEVTALDEPHGVALLQSWGGAYAADTDACQGIYTLVGELTLALELAGRHMQANQTPATDVLADLKTAFLNVPELGEHRRDSVRVLLAKSVAALSDGARDALSVMGLLANRPFPFALLAAALNLEPTPTRKLVAELMAHGLATREGEALRTRHALVHAYAREAVAPPDDAPARLAKALAIAANAANQTGLPTRYAPLRPHVAEAALWAEDKGLEDADVLWHHHGRHLDMIGNYPGARVAYERVLVIRRKIFDPTHPEIGTILNDLGTLLQNIGDYKTAQKYLGQALEIYKQAFGENYPWVATAHNNLGNVLWAQGDYAGARAAYERALAIDEAAFGPTHPNVARDVNNLGVVMQAQGDYAGARAAYERALAIWKQALGEDHPQVALGHNNLGSVLQDMGDYAGARAAYAQALAIDEAAFGPDHPNVAIWVNNLAGVMYAQGDYAGARAAYERALAIDEAAFGPAHPNLARDINNLGVVMKTQGDYAEARAAYERALAIDEAAFGPHNPKVSTRVNNLGMVMYAQGDYAGARAAYERALAIDEAAFGPAHPNVARDVNNLGSVMQDMGDYAGAQTAYERALAIDEAAFGPTHPNVARDVNNLGEVMRAQGDYAGARAAYGRALVIDEAAFGTDHPNVATLHNNLGLVMQAQGDYAGARAAYGRALAIFERFLGPDHPNTKLVRENLEALEPGE